jgi:hypothetical protein
VLFPFRSATGSLPEKKKITHQDKRQPQWGEIMSELLGLAFLLAARAKDSGLSGEEIAFLLESQLEHLEMIEALRKMEV